MYLPVPRKKHNIALKKKFNMPVLYKKLTNYVATCILFHVIVNILIVFFLNK